MSFLFIVGTETCIKAQPIPVFHVTKERVKKIAKITNTNYESEMISILEGTFKMGSETSFVDERPIHTVKVSGFKMAKYETTVGQYRAYCNATGKSMPNTPDWGWQSNYPIVNVSWNDARDYCIWLSGTTGKNYRLPTEAQWEYAARGGNKSQNYTYSGSNNVEKVAWYNENSGDHPHICGRKSPNELGLYDMSGNVTEYCGDWYGAYEDSQLHNPVGSQRGKKRVTRGGDWWSSASIIYVASRCCAVDPLNGADINGFRVVQIL